MPDITKTLSGAIRYKRGTTAALEASNYVPAAGELIIATDTGSIKVGDGQHTWLGLPLADETVIVNNYNETASGKALDATKGKDLNDRLTVLETYTDIDCGEIQ